MELSKTMEARLCHRWVKKINAVNQNNEKLFHNYDLVSHYIEKVSHNNDLTSHTNEKLSHGKISH